MFSQDGHGGIALVFGQCLDKRGGDRVEVDDIAAGGCYECGAAVG